MAPLQALDCPHCGHIGLPNLVLLCTACRKNPHSAGGKRAQYPGTLFSIEIKYTGNHPERLPEYAKLFMGGAYKGNIPLIERQEKEKVVLQTGRTGLGFDYTAFYRLDLKNLVEGVYTIELEMQFKRYKGLLKEKKRVTFPYMALKKGHRLVIQHVFQDSREFSQTKKKSKPSTGSLPFVLPQPELRMGSGTMSLETPIFE
jgi:hypothetical protein